ncbi:MAG: hypothetical protein IPH04_09710 [Saprospirales bacterium]|nr:hypothetical protein [Saprospirales bacterium]
MAKDTIIAEAKTKAKEESHRIVVNAKTEIEHMKMAAIIDLKNQVGTWPSISRKNPGAELKNGAEHEQYVSELVKDMKLNKIAGLWPGLNDPELCQLDG